MYGSAIYKSRLKSLLKPRLGEIQVLRLSQRTTYIIRCFSLYHGGHGQCVLTQWGIIEKRSEKIKGSLIPILS